MSKKRDVQRRKDRQLIVIDVPHTTENLLQYQRLGASEKGRD